MGKDSASEAFAIANYERGNQVEQTEFGLALLVFGILLSPVPVIGSIGGLIVLVGIMMIIIGREPFGKAHSKFVIIGAMIFFAGTLLVIVESILHTLFFLSAPSGLSSEIWPADDALTRALVPHLTSIFAIGAAGAIPTNIALTFFIFFLQKMPGRVLSLVAAATGVTISIIVFSLMSYYITTPLGGQPDSLLYQGGTDRAIAQAFELQVLFVNLLNFVPAIIYAAVYRAVYSNLN